MNQNTNIGKLLAFLLGFNTVIIQLVVFREIFSFLYGNELIFGAALALWFLFTGSGAILARVFKKILKISVVPWLFCIPLIAAGSMILLFMFFRNSVFLSGVAMNPLQIVLILTAILLPVCLVSGFVFTSINSLFASAKEQIIDFYAIESLGSVLGGVVFCFILVRYFNLFQVISFLSLISAFVFIGMLTFKTNRWSIALAIFVLVGFSGITQYTSVQDAALRRFYQGQKVVETHDNEYGKTVVTQNAGQYNLYENGMLTNTSNNEMANEESVHYAMVQRDKADNVLVISGNISLLADEIHKYPVKKIDYVEINPDIKQMQEKFFSKKKPAAINEFEVDAGIFIRNTKTVYDIILLNTAEPTFAQTNRFYTVEFFEQLKKCMKPDAVFELSLTGVENYMNNASADLNSSVFNSLKQVFQHVILVPGNKLYFIASDGPLTLNIAAAITARNIQNLYVNQYYLDDELIKQRSEKILSKLKADAPLNHDLKPITYFYGLKFWLSQYQLSLYLPFIVICIVLLLFLLVLKPVNISLFSAGFTSSSVEMIIIVAYQALYGYVYAQIGIIFTLFMTGLFLGSYLIEKRIATTVKNFFLVQICVIIFLAILWGIFQGTEFLNPAIQYVFYLMILLQAMLTGIQFAMATQLKDQATATNAGNSYGIELFGSAAGALLITVIIIPLLGIPNTIAGVIIFNLFALLIMAVNRKFFSRFA